MTYQTGHFSTIELKEQAHHREHHRSKIQHASASYLLLKRTLDFSTALLVSVLLLSWIIPLLALVIRIESKGSPFFSQKRTGKNGIAFTCLKLRTMRLNDEADTKQATDDDERITRIGRFLRLSSLDELPQFLNVLKGDMSLVGPRPHMLYHTLKYESAIPYYKLRHQAKPGITGLAQVKGLRGPTANISDMEKRIQADLDYIANRRMELDLNILGNTAKEVWRAIV